MSTKTKKTITILGIVIFVIAASLVITAIVLFTTQKKEPQHAFGNVVSYNGELYYWKYSKDSFSSEEASGGHYEYRVDTTNQLVCRHENGEESVIVFENGAENICIVGDRIFYQVFLSEPYNLYRNDEIYKIKSCSLTGEDIIEYGDGILLGLIENDKYLITQFEDEGICSVNTQTWDKTVISVDSFLICAEDSVICYRSNNDESGFNEEFTIHSISGDGQSIKTLYTEKASTMPIVIQKQKDSDSVLRGYFEIKVPFIYNNKLFYMFDFISGTFTQAHTVGRITSIDLNTGDASEILGNVDWQMGSYFNIDINSDDEAVIAYKDYISNLDHWNIIDENDFSEFSDENNNINENEDNLLKVWYCEEIEDREYIFLTSGIYIRLNGMYSMFQFEKCALFEKDLNTGECSMIYSSTDPDNYTDLAERGPIIIKAGEEIDCDDYLFSAPDTWEDAFAYKKLSASTFFYFVDEHQQSGIDKDSDNWHYRLSLNLIDEPEPAKQPHSDGTIYYSYILAKLKRDEEEKLIEAKYSSTISDAEDDHDYMMTCFKMLKDGLKAKPGTEIKPLEYSDLDGTAWYTIADDGTVFNFNVFDVDANIISATMSINGEFNPEKVTIQMTGNMGQLQWNRINDNSMTSNKYFNDDNTFGYGSLECIDNNKLIITMTTGTNSEHVILDGLTFVNVYVPRGEEKEYISGKIKESCEYFEISLPDCWEGLYTCEKSADSLTFFHAESMKNGYGGHICTIKIMEVEDYESMGFEYWTPVRKFIANGAEKYICFITPTGEEYSPRLYEQYKAISQGRDAALSTLSAATTEVKLEKFDIGLTSEKYVGTNENGDHFELILKWVESSDLEWVVSTARADLVFCPISSNKKEKFQAIVFKSKNGYGFTYDNYYSSDSVVNYASGNGEIEINGDTIRLNLKDVTGDLPVDEGGAITLTSEIS